LSNRCSIIDENQNKAVECLLQKKLQTTENSYIAQEVLVF